MLPKFLLENLFSSRLKTYQVILVQTQFLSLDVQLPDHPSQIQPLVLATLRQWGEPLRWAIASLRKDGQVTIAVIEAVITVQRKVL
jgi:hypothetical protein